MARLNSCVRRSIVGKVSVGGLLEKTEWEVENRLSRPMVIVEVVSAVCWGTTSVVVERGGCTLDRGLSLTVKRIIIE